MTCRQKVSGVRGVLALTSLLLIASACSGSESDENSGNASLKTNPPTSAPLIARQVEDPVDGEVTPTAPVDTTAPAPVIHVLGAISSLVGDSPNWDADVPAATDDVATIATLSCDPTTPTCETETLAAWSAGAIEVVNLATSEAAAASDQLSGIADELRSAGLEVLGYGTDQASAISSVNIQREDITVSVFAVSLEVDPAVAASASRAGVAGPAGYDDLLSEIAASRAEGSAVIVLVELGSTDDRAPTAAQIETIQRLVELDVDAVVGHGSDFIQRFDRVANSTVAYSLGNATTDSDDPLRADTAVLRLEFGSPGRACLLPATASATGLSLDDPSTADCSE